MNIVVIVIDTLRYDHIGAHGNDWIQTPNMDRLAAQSWVFDRSYACSYPTIPHRTDMMTGRYGGPFHPWRPLRFDLPTLPEHLSKAGYCTQLIHDTPHLVNGGHNFDWPFHAWTFIRGAEVDRPWIDNLQQVPRNWGRDPLFDDIPWDRIFDNRTVVTYARANRERQGPEDWSTARLFDAASQWVHDNQGRDNGFLWIDCFDPHEPWDVPAEFIKRYDQRPDYDGRIDPRGFVARNETDLSPAAREHIRARYAAKVTWVDRNLGKLLDALQETGLDENTAVLVTADHGSNIGMRGRFGKSYPVREGEGHTPMIIRVPGGESGRSDIFVQPQDVVATLLNLAGVEPMKDVESYDILTAARRGGAGQRDIALAGRGADQWSHDPSEVLFTVFADDVYLELAANPAACHLTRYGTVEDIADQEKDTVQRLHTAGIDELERRGADQELVRWLRGHGQEAFPSQVRFWDGWPGPAGYTQYFQRLCLEWGDR
jgi:arylsulfatase A-like enzyme